MWSRTTNKCKLKISRLQRETITINLTNYCYYITVNYKPCETLTALLDIRLTVAISGPISNITV